MIEQTKYNSRQRLLATRAGLSSQWVNQADEFIRQHVLQFIQLKKIACLAVYFPIRNEPDLTSYYARYAENCQLALPVCSQSGQLHFMAWTPGQVLVAGNYNIPVPAQGPLVRPEAILIPCVGFNSLGYRLGYGGGWFDRTLAAWSASVCSVGVAYNCLRDEHFAAEPHDIPLTTIVTESGCFYPPII